MKAVLVGYREETKVYRLYDSLKKKIFESRHVTFSENNKCFDNFNIRDSINIEINDYNLTLQQTNNDDGTVMNKESTLELEQSREKTEAVETLGNYSRKLRDRSSLKAPSYYDDFVINKSNKSRQQSDDNADNDIEQPVLCVAEVNEPINYREAINGLDQEKWRKAIDEELQAHQKNETWSIIQMPENCTPIDSKWVFKIKQDDRYKARLSARCFKQVHGIDFEETFSPVVRYETLRFMLALAAKEDFEMKQFDVKTAFLHGKLQEQVYMKIPEGLSVVNKNNVKHSAKVK